MSSATINRANGTAKLVRGSPLAVSDVRVGRFGSVSEREEGNGLGRVGHVDRGASALSVNGVLEGAMCPSGARAKKFQVGLRPESLNFEPESFRVGLSPERSGPGVTPGELKGGTRSEDVKPNIYGTKSEMMLWIRERARKGLTPAKDPNRDPNSEDKFQVVLRTESVKSNTNLPSAGTTIGPKRAMNMAPGANYQVDLRSESNKSNLSSPQEAASTCPKKAIMADEGHGRLGEEKDSPVKFKQYFGSETLGFKPKEDPISPDREMVRNHESMLSTFKGTARPNTMGELVKSAPGSGSDQHADHCATDAKDWDEETRVFMLSSNGGKLPEHGGHSVAGQERVENGPSAHSKPGQGAWAPEMVIPIPVTLGTLTSLATSALDARTHTHFYSFTNFDSAKVQCAIFSSKVAGSN